MTQFRTRIQQALGLAGHRVDALERQPDLPRPESGPSMVDTWKGTQLPERHAVYADIHYRIYNAVTGELLSFGTTNTLDTVTSDALRTQTENPTVWLFVAQVDGAAWL
ncbi:hypothetical protein [Nocardia brasiliensis]|uniref:hypothetical protein n=1 Tax=Nocardia brasiliensis TaxID=37326 RepID=UPI002453CBA5|nr:hypothetical protein [Nocardia brasiliensis]